MNKKHFFAAVILLSLLVTGLQFAFADGELTPVGIDIKPGSDDNTINLGSFGVIPVAILSSPDFDATTVDPETVTLAGAEVAIRGNGNKYLVNQEDVNGDGLIDLVCKIETENLEPAIFQNGGAFLTGIANGVGIEGFDLITIVP